MTTALKKLCLCLALVAVTASASPARAAKASSARAASASPAPAVNNGDVPINTVASARRMIEDLNRTYGQKYQAGPALLKQLADIEARLKANADDGKAKADLVELIRQASLANPLLDFDRLLVIRRTHEANRSLNAYTSTTIQRKGWDNEISELSNLRGQIKVRTVYRHPDSSVMKHMDLNFAGKRIMFSGVGANGAWAVLEVDTDGKNLRELTPSDQPDVQWFDSCYLPDEGQIIACSTAGMQGLPCVNGSEPMVNLYRVNTRNKSVRQLTFEQDSDWHPRVLNSGRVLYLRWEYTDIPHYFSRYLFQMNPDGSGQVEHWGSGSYFPTAYVWPRPIPDHPSKIVGIASGHHAKSETGRLLLLDPELGRKYPLRYKPKDKVWGPENSEINIHPQVLPAEMTGCVQEIPGWGRDVVGNVYDNQGGNQKYTFGTPWPLSEKYFLVSMTGFGPGGKWNLCLVDIYDNMTVLYSDPKYSIFEPILLAPRKAPPVLSERIIPSRPTTIYCSDVYGGRGLKDVPRGTVKSIRVLAYHYGYMHSGGHESVGLESSWDIKRILGTVPVEKDGSFCFEAPPYTPLAIQPLDANGASVALMRSWMTGMPGEVLSCNGCHEDLSKTYAAPSGTGRVAPRQITPWYGPTRPFGYAAEVQPMLNKYCVGCHNDANQSPRRPSFEKGNPGDWQGDRSYLNLVAFVCRPGPESDMDLLPPMEYHASISPLIQMLAKGHHGVQLDAEAWSRLYTWIDLNAPHRGMWNNQPYEKRRLELAKLYAGLTDNPEEEYRQAVAMLSQNPPAKPIMPHSPARPVPDGLTTPAFPFDAAKAKAMQGDGATMELPLGGDLTMKFIRIPAGQFVMGSQDGFPDEAPRAAVKIDKPFWMGICEVTNKQYAQHDPEHDTRYIDETGKDHAVPGYIANHDNQPVARISWQEAMRFCKWLSQKAGRDVTLPTEAQWEWAARAGSATQFYYGDANTDFGKFANLADADRRNLYVSWDGGSKIHVRRPYPADYLFPLRDDRFKDNWFIVDFVGQCQANAWGLNDMIGNATEWTRSSYRPYPYKADDGRNNADVSKAKVARGGSWFDRPKTAGASVRFRYESYQKVFNVGFRVIVE